MSVKANAHVSIIERSCPQLKKKDVEENRGREDFYIAEAAPGVKWGVACLVFTCFSSFLEYVCAHAHRKVEVSSQRMGAGSSLPPCGN